MWCVQRRDGTAHSRCCQLPSWCRSPLDARLPAPVPARLPAPAAVLLEPGQEDLAAFLADHSVRVVASLPCYSAENVDSQRGGGVFRRSIAGLQALNAVGYGQPGSGLSLDLVYNPGGVFLAPPQAKLEPVYKQVGLRCVCGVCVSACVMVCRCW